MDVYNSDQLLQVQCCGLKKSLFVLLPPWVGFSVGCGLVCPVKKYDLWAPPPYSVLPSTHTDHLSLILYSDWYDCHKLWLSNSNGYCHQIDSIPNSVFNCLCILWWSTSIICAHKNFHISILCVASISPKISNNPQCLVQQRLKLKARNHLKQCAHLDIVLFFKVFPKDSRFYFFCIWFMFFFLERCFSLARFCLTLKSVPGRWIFHQISKLTLIISSCC